MIKLVAIDLDGTLLNAKKKVSQRNFTVLKKVQKLGVKVVLCTGRPLKSVETYIDQLGLLGKEDFSITFNGGLVQQNKTGHILAKEILKFEDIGQVYKVTNSLSLPLDVLSMNVVYHVEPAPSSYPSIYAQLNPAMDYLHENVNKLNSVNIYNKMVVAVAAEYLDQQLASFPAFCYERFEIVKSRNCLLEILPKSVSKAKGIDSLISHLGITADEVMSIGDEENDLSMIEYAGVGVAMGNAVEKVKQQAQFITADNEADGVAEAIEKYILNA